MAFQLLLQKVTGLERSLQSMTSLLTKIVGQLEAQTKQPEIEIASYTDLYPELPQDESLEKPDVQAADPLPPLPAPRGWRRWFYKEVP